MGQKEQMKEQIIGEFQRRGMRMTKQRSMILDVILEKQWTDCKEIYYEVIKRDPDGIGILKRGRQYAFDENLIDNFYQ